MLNFIFKKGILIIKDNLSVDLIYKNTSKIFLNNNKKKEFNSVAPKETKLTIMTSSRAYYKILQA